MEAYAIADISPKASVLLCRRCLQTILRDHWDINKWKLEAAIKSVKNRVAPEVYAALEAIREIGNIGAHSEQDINVIIDISSDEAREILKVIEFLIIEWYASPHELEPALKKICTIQASKNYLRVLKTFSLKD